MKYFVLFFITAIGMTGCDSDNHLHEQYVSYKVIQKGTYHYMANPHNNLNWFKIQNNNDWLPVLGYMEDNSLGFETSTLDYNHKDYVMIFDKVREDPSVYIDVLSVLSTENSINIKVASYKKHEVAPAIPATPFVLIELPKTNKVLVCETLLD